MKLAEAWHLSRIPYKEVVYRSLAEEKGRMWWGAFGRSRPAGDGQDELELTERALRIAKFDKVIVAIFNVVVALIPFVPYFLGTADFGLASSIALSLIVTFGFTTLYAIQTLSSFVGAESTALLSTLPIAQGDFALITLFSFIRSVDYMVIGSVLIQVIAVAFVTGSAFATLIMLVASAINALFAVAVALWFSRVFQKNLMRGGRSRVNTILRLVFILMWGFLLVGVGLLFTLPWYLVGNLDEILLQLNTLSMLLSCLYPFSTGIVIADLFGSSVAFTIASIASVVLLVYVLFAVLAGRWSLGTVRNMSRGAGVKITRVAARDFAVKTHSPLLGYVLKDLKISSRNPATAFFFALPLLETLITTLLISNFGALRTAAVLMATSMGAIFALISPLALLSAEGRGLEYTKTLPISSRKIVISKALISTGAYVFVPLALVGLSFARPLTAPSAILIPFFTIIAVASASVFEIVLFLRTTAKGQMAAIANDVQKLFVGVLVVLVPMVAYALAFLSSLGHSISLFAMGATVLAELTIAVYVLRNS
jgi:predicted permease